MSYGTGIVIIEDDINKDKIRWDFCDWTTPTGVKIYPEDYKKDFKIWYKDFKKETKVTTLEKLKTAPCDCVCIINKNGDFQTMNRKDYKLSNEPDIKKHLII